MARPVRRDPAARICPRADLQHYGGEVHEIGFLLLFFAPCFYCNVSDAWLFREKSKRLWVSFAGGYFELFLWPLAVFVWRVTMPDSLINSLAFVVLSICGVQTLFNFNPLLKLDGYYLLSDWLEVPNLQQRALGSFKSRLRGLLCGAARPAPHPFPCFRNVNASFCVKHGSPFLNGERGLCDDLSARLSVVEFRGPVLVAPR